MVVIGTVILVSLQLKVGISQFSNGRERMVVIGTVILVMLQLATGISPSSNGRVRMVVIGTCNTCLSTAAGGPLHPPMGR